MEAGEEDSWSSIPVGGYLKCSKSGPRSSKFDGVAEGGGTSHDVESRSTWRQICNTAAALRSGTLRVCKRRSDDDLRSRG